MGFNRTGVASCVKMLIRGQAVLTEALMQWHSSTTITFDRVLDYSLFRLLLTYYKVDLRPRE